MRGPDKVTIPRAHKLRRDSTLAEARLWEQLRSRRLKDLKFVRQHPIGPYFADFACRDAKLVIEVDGATHATPDELKHDRIRTDFMQQQGYRVLLISNDEVLNGMDEVLTLIRQALDGAASSGRPSPPPSSRLGPLPLPAHAGRGQSRNPPRR